MLTNTYKNNSQELLFNYAKLKKLPHSVILESEDTEKSLQVAKDIIGASLCIGKDVPCGKCGNCIKVKNNSHSDVKIIEAEGKSNSVKIDNIRFIREDAYILSNEGNFKFYVISDADYMTVQAQNALIKILEEPPQNVVFILICKFSENLLGTVRSRSQIFKIDSAGEKENPELNSLAEKIVDAALNGEKSKIIEYFSAVSNDRRILKKLTENIIECFLKNYVDLNSEKKCVGDKFIRTLENLKYLLGLIDKNINFKLLVCCLCSCF